MSFYGSLYASTAGMMAQSKATAAVSQNVANVSTTGYKRSDIHFLDLVTTPTPASNRYQAGGVDTTRILRADQQGGIQQTSSQTDISITGNGFFTVRTTDDATDTVTPFLYTRNGTFNEDANGILRNTAGQVLYAWPLDANGAIPSSSDSLDSLAPLDVTLFDSSSLATTNATFSVNLASDQPPIDPHRLSSGAQQLPVTNAPEHYTRAMTVYDGRAVGGGVTAQDIAHNVSFEFRKTVGPMAHFTADTPGPLTFDYEFVNGTLTPSLNSNDRFTLDVGGVQETYRFVSNAAGADLSLNRLVTAEDLVTALEQHGGGGLIQANLDESGRLLVRAIDPGATITLANDFGIPLNPGALNIINDPDAPGDFTFEPDYNVVTGSGLAYPNQGDFPSFDNTTDPNPFGWWEMRVMVPDPSDPTGQTLIENRRGLINFDGQGQLNTTRDASGNPVGGIIDLASSPIDFDGNPGTGDEVGFTVDINRFTSFSGNFTVLEADQNGAGAGNRTGIEFERDGTVVASFSNGLRRDIYQIPLATFTNPNGLNDLSGTAFEITTESGPPTLSQAGTGGAGLVNGSTLENANVDIGAEFGKLIVSQRGFTLNSRVISTIDQMTQRLSELSR